MKKNKLGSALLAGASVVVLAACGAQPAGQDTVPTSAPPTVLGSASPAAGSHNDADVQFATMMIPHHRQAVTMSDLLLAKDGVDPAVQALAKQIKAAQAPEITTMSGWLAGWGANPSPAMGGMDGASMGMMSQAELDRLKTADAASGTTIFLAGMIKHHQGAVAMAQTELNTGQNTEAKALAQSIVTNQQAEISRMQQLQAG